MKDDVDFEKKFFKDYAQRHPPGTSKENEGKALGEDNGKDKKDEEVVGTDEEVEGTTPEGDNGNDKGKANAYGKKGGPPMKLVGRGHGHKGKP